MGRPHPRSKSKFLVAALKMLELSELESGVDKLVDLFEEWKLEARRSAQRSLNIWTPPKHSQKLSTEESSWDIYMYIYIS
jgi:hypothetical protein